MKLRAVLASPWTYLAWLAFVLAAFLVTYRADPYAYGFTVLGLAWASGALAAIGIVAIVHHLRGARAGRAAWIGLALLGIAATVIRALEILKGFRWA